MHGLTFHGRPSTRRPAITMHVVRRRATKPGGPVIEFTHVGCGQRLSLSSQRRHKVGSGSPLVARSCAGPREGKPHRPSRHHLTTSFGRFYPPTDLVAAATAAAPYGLCMIWCRTALSRSTAEVRKAVKNARRAHYARPRTAPDMHHDASYEVASSAEVIQGRTARSRPSATRVHSPVWEKG